MIWEPGAEYFTKEINAYFRDRGIGWQLSNGRIETRGSEIFEDTVQGALDVLARTGRSTANAELREARMDISRRPEADVTGAIQHAMAALECVARDITGDAGSTLGKIISDNPNLLPKPLDQAIDKAWGYASNNGRHLREDGAPSYEESPVSAGYNQRGMYLPGCQGRRSGRTTERNAALTSSNGLCGGEPVLAQHLCDDS